MPVFFVIVGVILVVVAFQNTYAAFFKQLGSDIPGFLPMFGAIVAIGALGYIPRFQNPARLLLGLVFLVLLLTKDKGFFAQFVSAVTGKEIAPTPEVAKVAPVAPGPFPVKLMGASGGGNPLSGLSGLLSSGSASSAGTVAGTIGSAGIV